MMKHLGHEFDFNKELSDMRGDIVYYVCNKCSIIVYVEVAEKNNIHTCRISLKNDFYGGNLPLNLTCDEVIIKDIIE